MKTVIDFQGLMILANYQLFNVLKVKPSKMQMLIVINSTAHLICTGFLSWPYWIFFPGVQKEWIWK